MSGVVWRVSGTDDPDTRRFADIDVADVFGACECDSLTESTAAAQVAAQVLVTHANTNLVE